MSLDPVDLAAAADPLRHDQSRQVRRPPAQTIFAASTNRCRISLRDRAVGRRSRPSRCSHRRQLRGDKLPIAFTGHTDTVPLGAQPWSVPPHEGLVKEGRLWGRGSSDMKSGVAAFVAAALRHAARLEGTAGVVLYITAGEETGCEGAFALARRGMQGQAGALVVAEPTSNRPLCGHKGALWLKATTRGVTAHGSMPDQGVNAVYAAARAVGVRSSLSKRCPYHLKVKPFQVWL